MCWTSSEVIIQSTHKIIGGDCTGNGQALVIWNIFRPKLVVWCSYKGWCLIKRPKNDRKPCCRDEKERQERLLPHYWFKTFKNRSQNRIFHSKCATLKIIYIQKLTEPHLKQDLSITVSLLKQFSTIPLTTTLITAKSSRLYLKKHLTIFLFKTLFYVNNRE